LTFVDLFDPFGPLLTNVDPLLTIFDPC